MFDDESLSRSEALDRARRLAIHSGESAYVVWTCDGYAVANEFDLDTWWLGATVIGEFMSDGEFVPAQ